MCSIGNRKGKIKSCSSRKRKKEKMVQKIYWKQNKKCNQSPCHKTTKIKITPFITHPDKTGFRYSANNIDE